MSPTQINLQAPADTNTGTVSVTASNSAGTSSIAAAMLDSMSPALFASANYVAAVRTDGTVINASSAAKPGDVLELYGTGFGPTSPAVAAGVVYQGAAPTATAVTVTMGGVTAPVSFAGLVGAGLYQLNVTVPSLPNGDYPVVAQAGSLSTQPGVLIKVQT